MLIINLQEQIARLRTELEHALMSEKEAIAEKMEYELRLTQLQNMVDRLTAINEDLQRRLDEAYDHLKKLKTDEMVARMKQVIAEQYSNAMRIALDHILSRVPKIGIEERQMIMDEIDRMTNKVFQQIANTMSLAKIMETKGEAGGE